jgi:rRNA maturation endonuclease Nob1
VDEINKISFMVVAMYYVCSRCLFIFKRSGAPEQCEDCGSPSVRHATEAEIAEYMCNREQAERPEPAIG